VPYRATGTETSVNLTITSDYKNDYGQSLRSVYSASTALAGSSLLGSTSITGQGSGFSSAATDILRYVILAAIVIAILASIVYIRRRRGAGKEPKQGKKSDVF